MSQKITCPHCNETYDLSEVLTKDIERHLKEGLQKELKSKEAKLRQMEADFEEKKKNENQIFKKRLDEEKEKMESDLKKEAEKEQEEKVKAITKKTGRRTRKEKGTAKAGS